MTYFSVTAQYPIFTDSNGMPLENGYVYIGEEGANPIIDPQTVYWDDGLLYPVSQPIRTLAGAPNRNGSPSPIFVAESFSILVQDKNQQQVYYAQSGNKNYTDNSLALRRNQVLNGRFEVLQLGANSPDRWQTDVNTYTLSQTIVDYDFDLFSLDGNLVNFIRLTRAHAGSPVAADYAKYVTVVENIGDFSGEVMTLSFLARSTSSSALSKIATSLDSVSSFSSYNALATGIGAATHTLTSTFTRYSVPFTFPEISSVSFAIEPSFNDTGIVVNFWLSAGSDYDTQTNGLGYNKTGTGSNNGSVDIADVRLNRGGIIDTSDRRSLQEETTLCERYYESSYILRVAAGTATTQGCVIYTADNTGNDITGFRFRTRKRTNTPTVTLYAPNGANLDDQVNHVGTGAEAVSAYNFTSDTGVALISLTPALVDGDYYQYHYVVDDEFTLP
jgi:hypothetical protein